MRRLHKNRLVGSRFYQVAPDALDRQPASRNNGSVAPIGRASRLHRDGCRFESVQIHFGFIVSMGTRLRGMQEFGVRIPVDPRG